MSSSQIRDRAECASVLKGQVYVRACAGRRGVWASDCFCQPSHIKVASAAGRRFLTVWQNVEGWRNTVRKRYGSKVGGWGHLGEKELPKQLPGFPWPASNCPTTLVHSLSLSLLRTHKKHTASPHPPKCGPHRGQPPNLPAPMSLSSLPPLSFN